MTFAGVRTHRSVDRDILLQRAKGSCSQRDVLTRSSRRIRSTHVAEVARPVLGLTATLAAEVDDDLEVLRLQDLTRTLLAKVDGLSVLEQEQLGRAVGRHK
jgi:hypothetical protein